MAAISAAMVGCFLWRNLIASSTWCAARGTYWPLSIFDSPAKWNTLFRTYFGKECLRWLRAMKISMTIMNYETIRWFRPLSVVTGHSPPRALCVDLKTEWEALFPAQFHECVSRQLHCPAVLSLPWQSPVLSLSFGINMPSFDRWSNVFFPLGICFMACSVGYNVFIRLFVNRTKSVFTGSAPDKIDRRR